jgi:hypothetical protein
MMLIVWAIKALFFDDPSYPVYQIILFSGLFDIINRPHFMRPFQIFRIV